MNKIIRNIIFAFSVLTLIGTSEAKDLPVPSKERVETRIYLAGLNVKAFTPAMQENVKNKIQENIINEQNKKEAKAEENIVTPVTNPNPYNIYNFNIIARVVYGEANNQCYEGKVAVATTVFNRVKSELFPDNTKDVVGQFNQYSEIYLSDIYDEYLTDEHFSAVWDAYSNIYGFPADMFYYRTEKYHDGFIPYIQIEDHYFSTQE